MVEIPFKFQNLILYILPIPVVLGFARDLFSFFKKDIYRIIPEDKHILKNDKKFVTFDEIEKIVLSKSTDADSDVENFELEIILKRRSNFSIGTTEDIAVYELSQKLSKAIRKNLELR